MPTDVYEDFKQHCLDRASRVMVRIHVQGGWMQVPLDTLSPIEQDAWIMRQWNRHRDIPNWGWSADEGPAETADIS